MRLENVRLGLLVVVLFVPLVSCRGKTGRLPIEPSPTTPLRAATATPPIVAPVTSEPDLLNGMRWELMSIESKENSPFIPRGPRLFLTFDRGALNLSGGCNSVGGHYVLDENQIEITFSKTTEMDCSGRYPGINQAEVVFFYAMSTFESYAIGNNRLAIHYAEGEILLHQVLEQVTALTPTVTSTRTVTPTCTAKPTQTPMALPTATQMPTPMPKIELPIGALAFISPDHQLLVRDPAGAICALTKGGFANSPAWSPDGTRLAFSYQTQDRSPAELRIYDQADGTQPTIWVDPGDLAPLVLPFRQIAWSPSGRYLFLSQGCCPVGALYLLDLETRTRVGRYTSSRAIWSPGEDLVALSVPQRVDRIIPIESGDSSSIALVHPGDIAPTIVLTGTVNRLYHAHAWLSEDELLYEQSDLDDEGNRTEESWWVAEIADDRNASPYRSLPAVLWRPCRSRMTTGPSRSISLPGCPGSPLSTGCGLSMAPGSCFVPTGTEKHWGGSMPFTGRRDSSSGRSPRDSIWLWPLCVQRGAAPSDGG